MERYLGGSTGNLVIDGGWGESQGGVMGERYAGFGFMHLSATIQINWSTSTNLQ